ncbi:MAG: type VI secretion system protein TssA [Planctomyces sp.]|nr:type VI secretion system protein TssA [Planctomyces sp.]
MASAPVLDIEKLCRPVSDEAPTGAHLRSSPDLEKQWWKFSDQLEKERGKEKRRLSGGDDGPDAKDLVPRWQEVVSIGEEILTTSSKDLWVVAGMIEALTRQYGFNGLRDGLRLARELTQKYGASMFPPLDEDDAADTGLHTAFMRLDGIDAALPDVIRRLPIVDCAGSPPYSTFDHVRIYAGRGGDDTPASLEAAARGTPPQVFRDLMDDTSTAIDELQQLTEAADAASGTTEDGLSLAPSLGRMKETLEDCLRRIRSLAGDSGQEQESTPGEGGPATSGAAAKGAPAASADAINTREDAYRVLEKLAVFFERTEPHSPMAAALRELVGWRTLNFADLMKRLIEDASARRELFRRTGVPNAED